ncbi:hypothetical protein MHYP_G00326500 [Metynnis hypsauchen]
MCSLLFQKTKNYPSYPQRSRVVLETEDELFYSVLFCHLFSQRFVRDAEKEDSRRRLSERWVQSEQFFTLTTQWHHKAYSTVTARLINGALHLIRRDQKVYYSVQHFGFQGWNMNGCFCFSFTFLNRNPSISMTK